MRMLKKVTDFIFEDLTEDSLMIDNILFSHYPYQQKLVKQITSEYGAKELRNTKELFEHPELALKIEGYEKLNPTMFNTCLNLAKHLGHSGPVTCHLFKSPKGSLSFPKHTDPDDVVIHMVSGSKVFHTGQGDITVECGDTYFIPRGLQHQAINTEDSILLSFGLELYLVDKLNVV